MESYTGWRTHEELEPATMTSRRMLAIAEAERKEKEKEKDHTKMIKKMSNMSRKSSSPSRRTRIRTKMSRGTGGWTY